MTHQKIVDRYVDVALGRTKLRNFGHNANVFAIGDTLYSYGTHFVLAELIRDGQGEPELFLLNGDRYSVSTTQHQNIVRSVIQSCGVPSVIIPFAALSAADVQRSSIKLLDISADRFETIQHQTRTMPEGAKWVTDPVNGYVDLTDEEIAAKVAEKNEGAYELWVHRVNDAKRVLDEGRWLHSQNYTVERLLSAPPAPITREQEQGMAGFYAFREYRQTGTRTYLHKRGVGTITVTEDAEGTLYSWTTHRHWLGESLIEATTEPRSRWNSKREQWVQVKGRRIKLLSGFDHNERRPSYFLCELPATDAVTIDDAYAALKPETVKLAELAGRTVQRQGDMFAIPMPSMTKRDLTKLGATFQRGGMLYSTNHAATETATLPDGRTFARGHMRHVPRFRDPDHARIKLVDAKTWTLVVKNTVPLAGR